MIRIGFLAALALTCLGAFHSEAQSLGDDRRKIESWLKSRYPAIPAAEYARGGAAFGDTGASPPDPSMLSAALARGKAVWERKFRNGRTLASCFPNGGKRIASAYPQIDSRSGDVVTFESAINQCLKQHGQPTLDFVQSREAGEVLLYARSLSNGAPTTVRVAGKVAETRYGEGRALFFTRIGARNQACASCHVSYAGSVMLDRTLTAAIGQSTRWPRLNDDSTVTTLQAQYQACFRRAGAEAPLAGSTTLNNLEYFHTSLSNQLRLRPAAERN